MNASDRRKPLISVNGCWRAIACGAVLLIVIGSSRSAIAGCPCGKTWPHLICRHHGMGHAVGPGDIVNADGGGHWYWVRSPEEERRVAMNLFNRYCIRCHGVDGRGVWDIPDVPDFNNHVWQATRPDDYRSRVILEGRGAVMPSFRGIITLEESWALARYLHKFKPGTEISRPGLGPALAAPPAAGSPAGTKPPTTAPATPPVGANPATPPPAPASAPPAAGSPAGTKPATTPPASAANTRNSMTRAMIQWR